MEPLKDPVDLKEASPRLVVGDEAEIQTRGEVEVAQPDDAEDTSESKPKTVVTWPTLMDPREQLVNPEAEKAPLVLSIWDIVAACLTVLIAMFVTAGVPDTSFSTMTGQDLLDYQNNLRTATCCFYLFFHAIFTSFWLSDVISCIHKATCEDRRGGWEWPVFDK